jgi:spore germination protein
MTVHVVKSGENLWSISAQYNLAENTIMTTNGLPSSASIVPGLALYIPDDALPIRTYTIRAGDNLWKLTQRFNTTIPAITAANPGVTLNTLQIGQIINIPSPNKLSMNTL